MLKSIYSLAYMINQFRCISLVALLLFSPFLLFSQNQINQKHVLFINSYHAGSIWGDAITQGVQSVLQVYPEINIATEFLDTKHFEDSAYFSKIYDLLEYKYKGKHFEAILASDKAAFDFVLEKKRNLFKNLPIFFCGIEDIDNYDIKGKKIFGILEPKPHKQNIELITQMCSNIKKLYVVSDNSITGQTDIEAVRMTLKVLLPKFETEYINNIDIAEIKKEIYKISPTDAIYLLDVNRDKYGKEINSIEEIKHISKLSKAPIFCNSMYYIGSGVLACTTVSGSEQGKLVGDLLKNFLINNAFPQEKTIYPQYTYYVDYNGIKRFNISENTIPKNAILFNAPVSFWKKNFSKIALALGVAGILTIIIIILSVNIIRRKKAESTVKHQLMEIRVKTKQLQRTNNHLLETNIELEETNEKIKQVNCELEVAKEKAEEADRLKTSFLTNLSHEIRTPLNAINGFSSLLISDLYTAVEKEEFYNYIRSNSGYLIYLIEDIIDLARIETSSLQLNNQTFRVAKLIEDINEIYKREQYLNQQVQSKNVSFRTAFAANVMDMNITMDYDRIKQIFRGLISNATKYTKNGNIEAGCYLMGNTINFYVKDTGIGIKTDNKKKIFEKFRKIEDDSNELYRGAGIGLTIVERLTSLMKGEITVDTEINKGTTFTLKFPMENKKAPQILHTPTEKFPENILTEKTVLIAEDDLSSFRFLQVILSDYKMKILWAKNGDEALAYLTSMDTIDLFLVDIMMPGVTGIEICKQVKLKNPDKPVVAQTAYLTDENKQKANSAGFDCIIEKPIAPEVLIESLTKVLNTTVLLTI